MTRKEYCYWFCNIQGISPRIQKLLMDRFQTPERIYHAGIYELEMTSGIKSEDIHIILDSRNGQEIRENYAKLEEKCIYFVTIDDNNYPEKLRHIPDPPYGLYFKGNLPKNNRPAIAVIGARNCTAYGREIALYFAKALGQRGVQIISGLAAGIDSCAHRGAIAAKAETFGILGCGADRVYPEGNRELYQKVEKAGGLITEYNIGTLPYPYNFPRRNRIISGLSDGILIVEARARSGTLITADAGLEQGKEIYVIPGRATDSLSKGCNNLIKMGAKLVMSPDEILEDLYLPTYENVKDLKKKYNLLETKEKMVYAILSLDPKNIDEIIMHTKLNMAEVMEALLSLELKNFVKQPIRNYYIADTDE